jgi:hypothetical protein
MPPENEPPLAQANVVDIREGQGRGHGPRKVVYLLRSQLDELVKRVRDRPDIVDLMAQEFASLEADPDGWRANMLAHGVSYDRALMALCKEIGLDHYVLFSGTITQYLWEKVRPDNV